MGRLNQRTVRWVKLFSSSGLWLAALALDLPAAEISPDFGKLVPIALFPSTREAARTNDIPIDRIDLPAQAGRLNPGDSLTALVTLFEKRTTSQWLLHVEAAELTPEEKARKAKGPVVQYVGVGDKVKFERAPVPIKLRLLGPFVEAKNKLPKVEDQCARVTLDKAFLGLGLDEAAAAFSRMRERKAKGQFAIRPRPFTEAEVAEGKKTMATLQLSTNEQRAIAGSQMAMMSYVHLVQETPGLDDLFYKVVKLPSVWSVVSHLGVSATLNLETDYVAPTSTTNWNLLPETPCYTFPLTLRVNGQPALVTTMVVVPPRPPLLQCGGIVGLLAEKPNDKKTYLILRIISARHAKEPEAGTTNVKPGS